MHRSEAIRQYLLENGEQIIADMLSLVEKQSPTHRKEHVEACADAIISLVRERLGAEPAAVYPQEKNGPHLYYELGEGRKKALMIGHYDTVWELDALPVCREGNRLAGPGTIDMKYGVVAGIWAVKALQATGGLDGCVGLFFNSDEETGSRTSRGCMEPIARTYANALILEGAGPDGDVRVGRKSLMPFNITVHGVAAHAGNDYTAGRSAILEAAYLTEQLFAMTDLEKGTTVNVGVISGGTKRNVIAASADLQVDVRVTNLAEGERMAQAIRGLQPRQEGVTLTITGGMNRPPFEFNTANQALFAQAKAAAAELGRPLEKAIAGGGSDGNFTSFWGIPTLDGLGAVGGGAHALTEHILIDRSLEHTALLASLLCRL